MGYRQLEGLDKSKEAEDCNSHLKTLPTMWLGGWNCQGIRLGVQVLP